MNIFYQSECSISVWHSYATLKFVNDIRFYYVFTWTIRIFDHAEVINFSLNRCLEGTGNSKERPLLLTYNKVQEPGVRNIQPLIQRLQRTNLICHRRRDFLLLPLFLHQPPFSLSVSSCEYSDAVYLGNFNIEDSLKEKEREHQHIFTSISFLKRRRRREPKFESKMFYLNINDTQ